MTDEADTNAVRKFKTPELRIKKQRRPSASDPKHGSGAGNSSSDSGTSNGTAAKPSEPAEPTIHVIRQDGLVQSIKVECACGQLIELTCVYDPTSDAAQATTPTPSPKKSPKPANPPVKAATNPPAKAAAAPPENAPTEPRADAAQATPTPTATPPTDSETRG